MWVVVWDCHSGLSSRLSSGVVIWVVIWSCNLGLSSGVVIWIVIWVVIWVGIWVVIWDCHLGCHLALLSEMTHFPSYLFIENFIHSKNQNFE
jgi:hypothetical protein